MQGFKKESTNTSKFSPRDRSRSKMGVHSPNSKNRKNQAHVTSPGQRRINRMEKVMNGIITTYCPNIDKQ